MPSAADYGALVERLDRQFREAPTLYKIKLGLLACFGFLVLGGSALFAVGISAGLVVVLYAISPLLLLKLAKILWIPVVFGVFLLKALWVKFDPPTGYRVRASDAPELFKEVERLRRETGAPTLEAILIDPDLNASAASIPRASGLFGHKHYLVIGLPLMQLLTREQMLAVIAHEFGHFGGGHASFAGWIYRVRVSWYRVLSALQQSGSSLTGLFDRFFTWYAPYFNAYSFTLARANEYDADAVAARVTGATTAGSALIRVHLGSARLEHGFWPKVRSANDHEAVPPSHLYRDMGSWLRRPTDDDAACLSRALAEEPGFDDTHPTLSQRLAALGIDPSQVPEPEVTAADALLGPLASELENRFSEEWRSSVQSAWEDNHRSNLQDTARLAELEILTEHNAKETAEYASLAERLRPELDHVALYRKAVAADGSDAYIKFRLGALLLEKHDADGVQYIRSAMKIDSGAIDPGSRILAHYFREIGDDHGLEETRKAFDAAHALRLRTASERGRVTKKDTYAQHGLTCEQLDAFRKQLRELNTVKKAWVVLKHVSDDPNEPLHFVILVAWRGFVFSEEAKLQKVVDALSLPGSFIVITAPNQRRIARRVRKTAGEPTFVR